MKVFIFGLLVVAASASLLENKKFQAFKSKHGKTYKNQVEETKRFNIFNANLRDIEEHNALFEQGLVSYQKGVNKFTDMTEEEFQSYFETSASEQPPLNATLFAAIGRAAPESVDWRNSGQLTPVKDQGTCLGCWAFSLTGASEAAYFRKYRKLVSLSEQQLIDCAGKPNLGCNGGYLILTYPYLKRFGFQSEQSYPYIGRKDETCKYDKSKVVVKVTGHVAIKPKDENALHKAVGTVGPVSVRMQSKYLSSYSQGIYSEPKCTNETDHAVLAVGYGSENGKDYWIIKNSWGADWGENGYFRMERGVNMCGIAELCVYPIIK